MGELTFDHVPPRKTFNVGRAKSQDFQALLEHGPFVPIPGKVIQGGVGHYSLCTDCNPKTGSWYGGEFATWTKATYDALCAIRGKGSHVQYSVECRPLRVLKQIATMFFSTSGPKFLDKNRDLAEFVLDRDSTHLPDRLRFYAYACTHHISRSSSVSGVINIPTASVTVLSEIAFPPLGYVLTFNGGPVDSRLRNITAFSRFSIDERADMLMHLAVLPTIGFMPVDFRTKEEILRHAGDPRSDSGESQARCDAPGDRDR